MLLHSSDSAHNSTEAERCIQARIWGETRAQRAEKDARGRAEPAATSCLPIKTAEGSSYPRILRQTFPLR